MQGEYQEDWGKVAEDTVHNTPSKNTEDIIQTETRDSEKNLQFIYESNEKPIDSSVNQKTSS